MKNVKRMNNMAAIGTKVALIIINPAMICKPMAIDNKKNGAGKFFFIITSVIGVQ
jgi:hypothetical protein